MNSRKKKFLAVFNEERLASAPASRSEASMVAVGFSPRICWILGFVAERRLEKPREFMRLSNVAPRRGSHLWFTVG